MPVRSPFFIASLLYILFIVVVTLYPFEYCARLGGGGALNALIQSAFRQPEERDFLLNVLFFVPLGFLSFSATNIRFQIAHRLLTAVLLAVALSAAIEIAQYFVGRNTSVFDLCANASGALLGALTGRFILGHRAKG